MTEAGGGRPTLQESVRKALSGRNLPDDARDYLSFVRGNYEIAAAGLLRWAITAVTSVILFQLLALAAIKGAAFGPVTLRNLGVVEKALPVFIAYCMYRSAVFGAMRKLYAEAHHAFLAEMDPAIVENGLERFVRPANVFLFGSWVIRPAIRAERAYTAVTRGLGFAVATWIVLFEVYAFYRLFQTFGADDVGTWISLSATVPLLILYRWVDASFAPPLNRGLGVSRV